MDSNNENNQLPIGPNAGYSYVDLIKTPSELKISNKGNLKQLGKNIAGIINYVKILTSAESRASKQQGNGPLGDAYFINTNSHCVDKNGNTKPRHFYINNVPPKTSLLGRGLVGGIVDDIDELNPMNMLNTFSDTKPPSCSLRTFKVIDKAGKMYKETRYVVDSEVTNYKDITDNSFKCRSDIQKKNGTKCCIFDENEKSLYPDSDDKIHCPVPQNILENAGFKNINNPYTYYNRKKLDKHFKMLILFIILMIFIFI
jgi:hypothetical protein